MSSRVTCSILVGQIRDKRAYVRAPFNVRPARASDLDRLVAIHMSAYPDARGEDARRRNFTLNAFGALGDLLVAESDRGTLGLAFLFPMKAWFGGKRVAIGGIASVAIAPEARGLGVGTALVSHLHGLSETHGDAVTMLYPFRQGFYARLDYAAMSSRRRLAFDCRSVPDAWRELARGSIRTMRPSDVRKVRALYGAECARVSGRIERTPRLWERLVARERRNTLILDGALPKSSPLRGYVAYSLEQRESHAETRIEVEELIATDAPSRCALLGALSLMRDQATEIVLEVQDNDPLERALVDPDGRRFGTASVEHALGEIVAGPMVRLTDIPRALQARGYASDGAFDISLRSTGTTKLERETFSVHVRNGSALVGPPRGGARLETNRAGLAAMVYGSMSVEDAVQLGIVTATPSDVARISPIVHLSPTSPIDAF